MAAGHGGSGRWVVAPLVASSVTKWLVGWPVREATKEGAQGAADRAGQAYEQTKDKAQQGMEATGAQGSSEWQWEVGNRFCRVFGIYFFP